MLLTPAIDRAGLRSDRARAARDDAGQSRLEIVVGGVRQPICAANRVVLDCGNFWSGYRFELIRAPASGLLENVSSPHHRIVFVVGGTCSLRYRAYLHDGRHRLSPGMFCFIGRGYQFERLAWKGRSFETIMIDVIDFGVDANPIDAFGRTDALFDMYIGISDTRVATLIDLMRTEIEAGCPTGHAYGEALSLALAARVASLCAAMPSEHRRAATLSTRQLQRVDEFVRANIAHELTIDRLASLVNMSPFHFARCFKHTTGVTPHQYVTRERVDRAKAMLTQGRRSIGDIAMAVGFSSQSHFADVYRRVTGTSPRRSRNQGSKR